LHQSALLFIILWKLLNFKNYWKLRYSEKNVIWTDEVSRNHLLLENNPFLKLLLSPVGGLGRGVLFWHCPSFRLSEFLFRASSLQLLAGIQRNFMGIINMKRRWAPVGLFQSDTLTQSYGPWLIMQYAYRVKIVSMLLLCNYWLEFN
jgi:hypothetical protein